MFMTGYGNKIKRGREDDFLIIETSRIFTKFCHLLVGQTLSVDCNVDVFVNVKRK